MPTSSGARTPEELEMLFEDGLVLRDQAALASLFEAGAALVHGDSRPARGHTASARRALALWTAEEPYLAHPRHVVVARDVALIVGAQGINVVRRDRDGAWRYAIVWQSVPDARETRKGVPMIQQTTPLPALRPFVAASDGGDARWWFGSLAVIKASAAQTGGQLSMLEVTEPAGEAAPWHVHHRDDEAFWILEGEVTFEVGGETITAKTGDFVFAPREIPHRYTVGPSGCRMLFILTPGGFDEMVTAASEPAASRTLPPPSNEEPDWEKLAGIIQAHGCEMLG